MSAGDATGNRRDERPIVLVGETGINHGSKYIWYVSGRPVRNRARKGMKWCVWEARGQI